MSAVTTTKGLSLTAAYDLARSLMNKHGLQLWNFGFDRAVRRAGQCRGRNKTITLSAHYVARNDEAEVKDTILHEIAHALAGCRNGHNHIWRQVCLQIGAKPERCYDDSVDMPKGVWKAWCGVCARPHHRHRQSRRKLYCGQCCRRIGFQGVCQLQWQYNPTCPVCHKERTGSWCENCGWIYPKG